MECWSGRWLVCFVFRQTPLPPPPLPNSTHPETPVPRIEATFKDFTSRPDIAVVLISQHVATSIRALVDAHSAAVPAVLEVPSSGTPYSPDTDTVFQRVKALFGGDVSAITAGGGEEEGGGGD